LNPKDAGENFAEKWNRPNGEGINYIRAFHNWHIHALESMKLGLNDLKSSNAVEDAIMERFGLNRAFTKELINETPRNWTLPGRSANTTLNSLSLATFAGISTSAAVASQEIIKPVDRLG